MSTPAVNELQNSPGVGPNQFGSSDTDGHEVGVGPSVQDQWVAFESAENSKTDKDEMSVSTGSAGVNMVCVSSSRTRSFAMTFAAVFFHCYKQWFDRSRA